MLTSDATMQNQIQIAEKLIFRLNLQCGNHAFQISKVVSSLCACHSLSKFSIKVLHNGNATHRLI
jgi:hypothetical protein